jgi:hypothetical protein
MTTIPAAAEKLALDDAQRKSNAADAAYTATPTVALHRKFIAAEIALAQAEAVYLNALDRLDVVPIRGVVITELQAFLELVAPSLVKADARAISDQIDALVKTAALPAAGLATAVARLSATYTAIASGYALVTASRTAASLPAARALGSGTAPTNAGQAVTELAAIQTANASVPADTAALEAELAAL